MFPFRSFAVYFASLFLLALANWLGVSFGEPTIDQILYHLHYSARLGIDVGRIFVWTFIVECLVFPAVFALGAVALQLLVTELLSRSGKVRMRRVAGVVLPAAAMTTGAVALMLKLSVFSWVGYKFGPDEFAARYVDPAQVAVKPRQPKNLVLVYVESLENTYGDARIWGRDLLKPVREVGGDTFKDYVSTTGATWTIAAIVGTQCGVPLRYPSSSELREAGPDVATFLPRATCMSDLLHAQGYRNVFLGGAPLAFSGKGQFLRDHHYDTMLGRTEWEAAGLGPAAFGEWGLFDDQLFSQAKARLRQLHEAGGRFNLTVLTLDTHNPSGFLSPACRARGVRSFEDIVECTSSHVADFARFVRDSGYLEDTQLVILGDHLAVSNPVYDRLRGIRERRVFNQFVSTQPPRRNTDRIVAFDLFPSLMEFTGFDVAGGRLGLGYSAFGDAGVARPAAALDDQGLAALSGSRGYERLWEAR